MEIYFDSEMGGKMSSRFFFMRHEGYEPIDWECKSIKGIGEDTFRDINNFWAYLPKDTQEEIFKLYLNIRETYNNVYELNTTYKMVNEYVQELYKLHPLSLVEYWVRVHSDIRYPDNLKSELAEDDRPVQTYLEPDYHELVVLSVALKVMVPIWGEYVSLDTGMSEMQREIFAMQLLQGTEIIDSKMVLRFKEFVDFVVGGQQTGMKNILFGIGSLGMPEYILSYLIVIRLSVSALSHKDDYDKDSTINLITNMWRHVRTIISENGGRSSGDDVKNKNMPNDSGNEEDNLSTAESYKAREDISDGERIAFDFAGLQIKRTFYTRILGEDGDLALLERQYKRNITRRLFNPTEEQIKLTELVVSKLFPTRALAHTDRQSTTINISIAQVALHQRGFSALADLLGANRMDETHSIVSSGAIKKEQVDILDEIYSYRRHQYQRNSRTKTNLVNPGVIAIDALFTAFSRYHWQRDVDNVIGAASTLVQADKGFVVPFNFKHLLADFIINLNEENKTVRS